MCGVIGFTTNCLEVEHVYYLRRIFRESKVRGRHAYGFAWTDEEGSLQFLRSQDLETVLNALESLPIGRRISFLGHTRYSTSGDAGVPENNQPIVYPTMDFAMVFNGVVSMGTRDEMEKEFHMKLGTENDGEIIANWILRGEDWQERLRGGAYSFAGVIYHKGQLNIYRNNRRPLWSAYGSVRRSRFVASTQDILKRAGLSGAFEITPGKLLCLNRE